MKPEHQAVVQHLGVPADVITRAEAAGIDWQSLLLKLGPVFQELLLQLLAAKGK